MGLEAAFKLRLNDVAFELSVSESAISKSMRVARGRAEAPAVVSLSHFFSEASGMSRSVRENSAQLSGELAAAAVVSNLKI